MANNWTSTEVSMMVMSVGATVVSLLVAISKSRCTTIKCCGAQCERDVIAQTDLENQLQSTSEPRLSVSPPPPLTQHRTPPIVNVASRVVQFNEQSNV